jgi:arylsulfatase A-like enzyme
LDALKKFGIEENTLVVFTSDNGHEMGAGNADPYQEGKRSLMVFKNIYIIIFYYYYYY